MIIVYDTDSVGPYNEIVADMMENCGDPEEWKVWEEEYVSGSGDWAVGGEMDVQRFSTKQLAHDEFLKRMIVYEFLKFLDEVGDIECAVLATSLSRTKRPVLIKWIFRS